jgi:hypothetical protein
MTKKSMARLARDAEKKRLSGSEQKTPQNTCWDDLNGIYQKCAEMLLSHTGISNYSTRKELIALVPNPQQLIADIKLLGSDLQKMNSELLEIQAQHKGKTGGTMIPDEVIESIRISEQYYLFMQRHDGVVMPTVYSILEQFDQAEKKLLEQSHPQVEVKNEAPLLNAEDATIQKIPLAERTAEIASGTVVE